MATITYDGRSFMLDGRRLWLTAGAIHHARIPRESWADRIHAAKLAGLNAVQVTVFWNQVEPRPGHFEFTGRADVRRFVSMVGEAGLSCILRPGPFVGSGWDLGGLPAWLARQQGVVLRSGNQAFLEACSRYITALAEQLRDLQVTSKGAGGPILLLEQEHAWTCGNDDLAEAYLSELSRYFREAGFSVPSVNSSNLWQSVEGQIDAWRGSAGLFSTVRQMAHVRKDQPRLVIDFPDPRVSAAEESTAPDPLAVLRRLAEAAAAGGQINLSAFVRAGDVGFWGARDARAGARALARRPEPTACVDEGGAPTPYYGPVRRLMSFCSAFGRVLAAASDDASPVVIDPEATASASVVHVSGAHGDVVWVFAPPAARAKAPAVRVPLVMQDGSTLEVPVGRQGVAWCLHEVHLGGRATLDYSTLCVLAATSDIVVCFGPAGEPGDVSINGTPVRMTVPVSGAVHTERIEGVTVVCVDEDTVDATFLTPRGVYVGVHSVDADGEPVMHPSGTTRAVLIAPGAEPAPLPAKRARPTPKPAFAAWEIAGATEHASGHSPRYASIDGPAQLAELGAARGYGWYRAVVKSGAARKTRVATPGCGDRLHVFVDGEAAGVLGDGAGAKADVPVSLRKGDRTVVVLAENAGHPAYGSVLASRKGLWRHLCEVTAIKSIKPEIVEAEPLDLLTGPAPLMEVRRGDATSPFRVRWTVPHRRKSPLAVSVGPAPVAGLVIVNGARHAFLDAHAQTHVWLEGDALHRGNNTVEFAPLADHARSDDGAASAHAMADLARTFAAWEVTALLTEKAEWAFAKWEPPAPSSYAPAPKTGAASGPTWWRSAFDAEPGDARPLVLTLSGMTKGQVYLNGEHLGRYFAETAEGEAVGHNAEMVLPGPLLRGSHNELVLFDEHGGAPSKVRLAYAASSRAVTAKA